MKQRESSKSFKHYIFIAFALMIMVTSWESNRTNAAVLTPTIPQESIRIRILANSDSVQDQALKGEIRDAVAESMKSWVNSPQTIEQARSVVRTHLPELDLLVGDMIRDRGYTYTHQVELGKVPFPAKVFENEFYPAGDYEALRITIGSGEGQNWWCVLFPPLCFVDSFTGESAASNVVSAAASNEGNSSSVTPVAKKKVIVSLSEPVKPAVAKVNSKLQTANPAENKPADVEVRFFLWDLLEGIASWFK